MAGPKKRRKQREQKWLQSKVDEIQGGRPEPSMGQFFVVDMGTGEKYPGLNLQQAQRKWREIGNAIYLSMDDWTPGKAPLKARFDAGPL